MYKSALFTLIICSLGLQANGAFASNGAAQCVIPMDTQRQSIFIVKYGVAYKKTTFDSSNSWNPWTKGLTPEDDVFLICGGSNRSSLELICEIPIHDGIKIAIIANDYDNIIAPANMERCDSVVWNGTGFQTQSRLLGPPVNLPMNISEFFVYGWGGDDRITGINDSDTRNIIFGDAGAGTLFNRPFYRPGSDWLVGGPGNDVIYGEGLDDRIWGMDGDDYLVGGAVNLCSSIEVHDEDFISGGIGNDVIYGDTGPDEDCGDILCGSGKAPSSQTPNQDTYVVRSNDTLYGNDGADFIAGGPGDDLLCGDYCQLTQSEPAKDILCGGPGRDWFVAEPPDVVYYELGDKRYLVDREWNIYDSITNNDREEPFIIECAWDDNCPTDWMNDFNPSHL